MPLEQQLKSLSLQGDVISHSAPANNDEWATILTSESSIPSSYQLTKTLVFKPKTPKSQVPIPLVVIALNSSATPSSVIAKSTSTKDPRLATADLVAETFAGVAPTDVGALSITNDNASKVKVVVDSLILKSPDLILAVHPSSASKTAFIKASDLVSYLTSVGAEIINVNFKETASAPPTSASTTSTSAPTSASASASAKTSSAETDAAKIDGAALIGITVDKNLDFPGWYQQILTKGEMLDYYDVSGCYIMRPPSYFVWEQIQEYFNIKIKSIGVQNSYFPMFVSSRVLEKEKDHIEGFAPEVAWVTRAGKSELEEPIAIRPTSETVMYPYYAKWIRSHRDLPLKLNQWNSVVRWEFKHPQPFLRTREFLWQEGHTAHLTFDDANTEVLQILDWYEAIYHELLAVPVIKGKKTEKEKFAGGFFTTTCEGYIPTTGRGIQGATSHCLGQNFSKMFGISVENPEGPEKPKIFAWQNSWGLSTRVIGVMVMVHSDNKGLVLPPRVAQNQVVIVPVGLTAKSTPEQRKSIIDGCRKIESSLIDAGVRVTGDYRDNYSPGWKFADWELRGVPIRIEFGPQDLKKQQLIAVRRDDGKKIIVPLDGFEAVIKDTLETVQKDLFTKAKRSFDSHIFKATKLEEFVPALNSKNVILAPFCGEESCEDDIKDKTARQGTEGQEVDEKAPSMGAKTLCIPFDQPTLEKGTKCIGCGKEAKFFTLFGRSY